MLDHTVPSTLEHFYQPTSVGDASSIDGTLSQIRPITECCQGYHLHWRNRNHIQPNHAILFVDAHHQETVISMVQKWNTIKSLTRLFLSEDYSVPPRGEPRNWTDSSLTDLLDTQNAPLLRRLSFVHRMRMITSATTCSDLRLANQVRRLTSLSVTGGMLDLGQDHPLLFSFPDLKTLQLQDLKIFMSRRVLQPVPSLLRIRTLQLTDVSNAEVFTDALYPARQLRRIEVIHVVDDYQVSLDRILGVGLPRSLRHLTLGVFHRMLVNIPGEFRRFIQKRYHVAPQLQSLKVLITLGFWSDFCVLSDLSHLTVIQSLRLILESSLDARDNSLKELEIVIEPELKNDSALITNINQFKEIKRHYREKGLKIKVTTASDWKLCMSRIP